MAQLKSTNIMGNLSATGNVLASTFIKLNGTEEQILLANGEIITKAQLKSDIVEDTNTWRPIKYGSATLNDGTTALEFVAGSNIGLTFANGQLTIANNYNYSLPLATGDLRGGIKIGYTATKANLPVQLDSEKAYVALTKDAITSALGYTPAEAHEYGYLPLSGGNLVNEATITLTAYSDRSVIISGNSIVADMSQVTGGWSGSFASVKDPTDTTTTMLGWYGNESGLNHIFMGGTYTEPAMRMTAKGQFVFKSIPEVQSSSNATTKLALAVEASATAAGLMSKEDKTKLDSIPPNAVYTDNKVTQTVTKIQNTSIRPLLLGNNYSDNTESPTFSNVTAGVYASHNIYIKPSDGYLYAEKLYSGGKEVLTSESDTLQSVTGRGATTTSTITANGFKHRDTTTGNDNYVLLAGGGTKAISDITGTTYGSDRGISLVNGKFGHSNTAITAQAQKGLYKISYDAYGHITSTESFTLPTKDSWNYDDIYVKYNTAQSLTAAQKTQARTNIGAGTSNFSGSYNDLTNKPTIPNPTDYYWANVKVSSTSSTATTPSVQKIGITGSTTTTANAAVTMEFDSGKQALKFVFA